MPRRQRDVGLVERHAVDAHLPECVAADDVVAGQADDALDEVVVRVGRGEPDEREEPVDGRDERRLLGSRAPAAIRPDP